ncbi:MAG: MATE family efflux transporter [Eubacteriales bacterium]
MQKILYFFSTKSMFQKEEGGEIPSNKEAYSSYLKMAWPCVLEALLLCMVNVIDTMMVGSLGETAIAAVGITSQPRFLLLAIVFSLNVGITAVVARRKGENNREAANSILKGMLILSVILGIIIAFIGITFSKQLMNLAGAQEDYLQDAIMYFQIIAFGLFFQTINLMINAAQRGSGKTRITMVTNMVSNIVNITFNYLLIHGKCGFPKLGVQGAAIATSLGCIVACTIAISNLFYKKGYLNIYLAWKQKITAHTFHSVVVVGSSAFVEQIFLRIGFMLYAIIVPSR